MTTAFARGRMDYSGYLGFQRRLRAEGFEEMVESYWCDRVSSMGAVSRMAKAFPGFGLEYEARWANKPDREELIKPTGMREMLVGAAFTAEGGPVPSLILSAFPDKAHAALPGGYCAELIFDDYPARLASSCIRLRDAFSSLDGTLVLQRSLSLGEVLSAHAALQASLPEANAFREKAVAALEEAFSGFRREMESMLGLVRDEPRVAEAMRAVAARP